MKYIVLFVVALTIAEARYHDVDRIYTKDEMDLVFNSRDVMSEYVECFLDKGPCCEIAGGVRKIMKQVVKEKCEQCSPIQRYCARTFYSRAKELFPEKYEEMKKKYDPQNKYFDDFQKAVADALDVYD